MKKKSERNESTREGKRTAALAGVAALVGLFVVSCLLTYAEQFL